METDPNDKMAPPDHTDNNVQQSEETLSAGRFPDGPEQLEHHARPPAFYQHLMLFADRFNS